jgi:molybdopterin synthase catalytic subunit
MTRLSPGRIDVAAVRARVESPAFGAIVLFEGVARVSSGDPERTAPVSGLSYEAWDDVAERELAAVEADTEARWPGVRVAVVHRTGDVPIGEAAVVIAVGAPHRDAAYAASRYAIDTLKERVPIWKKETSRDGTSWIGNRP